MHSHSSSNHGEQPSQPANHQQTQVIALGSMLLVTLLAYVVITIPNQQPDADTKNTHKQTAS